MSENHRPSAALVAVIAEMDGVVNDLQAWAKAFQAIGGTSFDIEEDVIAVMANALAERVADMKHHFDQAFALTHPSN